MTTHPRPQWRLRTNGRKPVDVHNAPLDRAVKRAGQDFPALGAVLREGWTAAA